MEAGFVAGVRTRGRLGPYHDVLDCGRIFVNPGPAGFAHIELLWRPPTRDVIFSDPKALMCSPATILFPRGRPRDRPRRGETGAVT